MNTLIKRVPLFAFVLAAVFAFTQPKNQNQKFAVLSGQVINITDQTEGIDYLCDFEPVEICTFEELPNGMRIPDSEVVGVYVPL
jgi:hypothetical protein